MNHFHYIVQGYEHREDTGVLKDMVSIDIIAGSEGEALSKAEEMVNKSFYRVTQVVEHNPDLEEASIPFNGIFNFTDPAIDNGTAR